MTRSSSQEDIDVTENGPMNTDNQHTLPLGARLFPGVDLRLWFALIVAATIAVVLLVGALAVAL
jgi:hypothetical protein